MALWSQPTGERPSLNSALLWRLILVAILAVGIRLAYQAGMEAYGGSFDNGSDSGKYLNVAHTILKEGRFAQVTGSGEIADAVNRVPVYPYFLAGILKLAGPDNLRAVVTVQAFLEFFTILGLGLAAWSISPRIVLPTALMAALIPNFIVQSAYILQENLFLLFYVWGLCAMLWAIRTERTALLLALAGLLFGVALLTKLVLSYFTIFIAPALIYALKRQGHSLGKATILSVVPLLAMFLLALPILISNYLTYGHAALSSQSGSHILNWYYACLASFPPCSGRAELLTNTLNVIQRDFIAAHPQANSFEISAFQQKIALERTLALPLWQIVASMAYGAMKNVMQTGFYEVLTQYEQPPTFFSAIKGTGLVERLRNFAAANSTNTFMMMWALAQVFLVLSRLVQAGGIVSGIRNPASRGASVILLFIIAYVLLILGPVSSPRYRIPAEPALLLFFGIGWVGAVDWLKARRQRNAVSGRLAETEG